MELTQSVASCNVYDNEVQRLRNQSIEDIRQLEAKGDAQEADANAKRTHLVCEMEELRVALEVALLEKKSLIEEGERKAQQAARTKDQNASETARLEKKISHQVCCKLSVCM